ncbi:extracellular solute-binding protein [Paenibacillus hemerocallicola]|uniref:Extracellular solute-binding protein n=1 Tax=Paenibacillus hemerocallicola TaxID=1172614 RepID=A0A5C4TC03_9BACL|nr:extracellular solute-binding protein [Paenibacillus hemerocallicola]TNJ66136.1 extracellular solute-binding protein [Paenibacillus hemerocallicola]
MVSKKSYFISLVSTALISASILSGCGGGMNEKRDANEQDDKDSDVKMIDEYTGPPVELLFLDANTGITEEKFEEHFVKPVKAKHPTISLKLLKVTSPAKDDIEALIAAGTIPDIVADSNTGLNKYLDIDYAEDLNPMIKKFNVDLTRFEPAIVETLQGLGRKKGIYGLPFGMNYGSLLYNKDIFDKFGVRYPDDVITWDTFIELTNKLTRKDGEVQYIGSAAPTPVNWLRQYGASNFDEKDEKAVLTDDKHKYVYSLQEKLFHIPGFINGNIWRPTNMAGGTIAMQAGWIMATTNLVSAGPPFDWDLSAYPVFKENPNYGNSVDFPMLIVSKASKHKEAAYRVLMTMISDEVQQRLNKSGQITALKDQSLKMTYAQDSQIYNGKNLQAIFKVSPAPLPDYSRWKSATDTFINAVAQEMALQKKDMNTALREQEERANKAMQELK